jgi:signal transduction histidine kinase
MATTPGGAQISTDPRGVVDQILAQLAESLEQRSSSLVLDGVLDPGLETQSRSIIVETITGHDVEMRDSRSPITVDYADDTSLHDHGRSRGLRDVDPAEPLMAAELLFYHALPVLAEHLGTSSDPIRVARELHHAIWRRFPPGAIAYVEVLRDRLAEAYIESRKRTSRDLHDRVAPELAVVRQHIELFLLDRREADLNTALAGLDSSLREVQSLAFDLRETVGDADLEAAISAYIERTPGSPSIRMERNGTQRPISTTVAEEAFAIMIECIRNARRHAREATMILVTIEWAGDALQLTVRDDGAGPAGDTTGTSLGLTGMSERAGAIGANIDFVRGPRGTSVVLRVPYLLPTRETA